MEMGILINAETDGASAEIQSCWELLCAKPHRTAPRSPDWHSFKGPASSLRWLAPAAVQGPRVPTRVLVPVAGHP